MVEIIAECSVNWRTMDEAKRMIRLSAEAGANLVKFQAYGEEALIGLPPSLRDRLRAQMLTKPMCVELMGYAESQGIEWFATPTSPERVDLLEDVGVRRYKVREKDHQNLPLLERILRTGKLCYVSCQAPPLDMQLLFHPRLRFLYVVPKYPPTLAEIDLSQMSGFHGFSSHYPDVAVPFAAVCLGAETVEVHLTLGHDRRDDPDAAVSLDFTELATLVRMIRVYEKLGGPRPREEEMVAGLVG